MNQVRMTSKLLDFDRAGLSFSRVLLQRSIPSIPDEKRKESLRRTLTPSATRQYWKTFVGVQLLGRKQPTHVDSV